jgi:hypothetical protein
MLPPGHPARAKIAAAKEYDWANNQIRPLVS